MRPCQAEDAAYLASIYNHYVTNTIVTFEETPVDAQEMRARLSQVAASSLPWLVTEADERVVGYAYATPWKPRSAYRFAVEVTIYLDPEYIGQGLGIDLYRALFSHLRQDNIHTAFGGIALPNPASVALHEKLGMIKVAHLEEVGYKFNRWVDVGYWQTKLTT
ncbi:GNAT family N-acetyltransferase [Aestuariibacter sp. A3R04]|nr:GNAT family N-acetyltransferase [Aestuariibacter sp. A3R04]